MCSYSLTSTIEASPSAMIAPNITIHLQTSPLLCQQNTFSAMVKKYQRTQAEGVKKEQTACNSCPTLIVRFGKPAFSPQKKRKPANCPQIKKRKKTHTKHSVRFLDVPASVQWSGPPSHSPKILSARFFFKTEVAGSPQPWGVGAWNLHQWIQGLWKPQKCPPEHLG